jgi:hypothetical protein
MYVHTESEEFPEVPIYPCAAMTHATNTSMVQIE